MVEMYQDSGGEWRWRVVADNGKVVADSGEGYINRVDCVHGLHVTARQILEAAISGGLLEVEPPEVPAAEQD
jgi:uncharacterized protein YegP (UPF0339 family)